MRTFNMEILLVYRDQRLGEEFWNRFGSEEGIRIIPGDIWKLTCDAIASPGNSFGDMGGGLDFAIRERFGPEIEKKLKEAIQKKFQGELPVGKALIISTGDKKIPRFISAPTMVRPGKIVGTNNVEKAIKAILTVALESGKIKQLAIPGLGTGVGGLSPEEGVYQMWQGYQKIKNCEGKK